MTPINLDISVLHSNCVSGYKGVYRAQSPRRVAVRWQAIVLRADGVYKALGTFGTPEDAAQAVARFYLDEFGSEWVVLLKNRRKNAWRVRRIKYGTVDIWVAEVKRYGTTSWLRICPESIGQESCVSSWNGVQQGWKSRSAALVAVRIYRDVNGITSTRPSPSPA